MSVSHEVLHGDDSYVVLPLAWCGDCDAYRPALGEVRQGWRCMACRTIRDELGRVVADVHPAPVPILELVHSRTRGDRDADSR